MTSMKRRLAQATVIAGAIVALGFGAAGAASAGINESNAVGGGATLDVSNGGPSAGDGWQDNEAITANQGNEPAEEW